MQADARWPSTTLLGVLAEAPQLAEYLVPLLTFGENERIISILKRACSCALPYYQETFVVYLGLRLPGTASASVVRRQFVFAAPDNVSGA